MDTDSLNAISGIIAAVGTVAVAILAIWGEWVRATIAGPVVRLSLRDERANLTRRQGGARTVYFHISVRNSRKWSPARNIRLLIEAIETRRPNADFAPERVVYSPQLTWSHPQFHEISPTLTSTDLADFGFLDEGADAFRPSLYITPNDFRGFVRANETKRFHITATADNYHAARPLVIEVSWDGTWTHDTEELMKHLVVRQVS